MVEDIIYLRCIGLYFTVTLEFTKHELVFKGAWLYCNKHLIPSSAIVVVLDRFPITPSPLPSPRRLLLGGYMSVSVEWALC